MQRHESDDSANAIAANYVQLCGTLAGFSMMLIVFLMSPGLFPDRRPEVALVFAILAGFGYIYAAGWSAIIPGLGANASKILRQNDKVFLASNILLWIAVGAMLFSMGYFFAFAVSILLLILAILVPLRLGTL